MNGFFAGTGACKEASASKQTPQLSLRAALSALCLSCRGKSIQILNVVQIQGFECKFWG